MTMLQRVWNMLATLWKKRGQQLILDSIIYNTCEMQNIMLDLVHSFYNQPLKTNSLICEMDIIGHRPMK